MQGPEREKKDQKQNPLNQEPVKVLATLVRRGLQPGLGVRLLCVRLGQRNLQPAWAPAPAKAAKRPARKPNEHATLIQSSAHTHTPCCGGRGVKDPAK